MIIDIIHFDSVESTNDIAGQMAKEGAPEGRVVVADEQTAGRGRFSRAWVSGKSKGLWFSLVLRPKAEAERISQLTMVMAVAVAATVSELYGLSLGIKWPNDLLLDGKKVCGILSEGLIEKGEVAHVIIGIGLNVEAGPIDAGYLEKGFGIKVDRDRLLKELLVSIKKWYEIWLVKGFEPVRTAWLEDSVTIGQEVEISDFRKMISGEAPKIFAGRAIDVDEKGALVVEGMDGEVRSFNSGEVSLRKNS